ncbi:MAG: sulfurtransferase [bacterium]
MSKFILRIEEFKKNFKDYIVLDCRGSFSGSNLSQSAYLEEHVSGSHFVDGETVLSGIKGVHGGRHPLPDMEKFREKMENLGISDNSKVVCYGEFGARALFMLRLLGVEASIVSVGIEILKKTGIPFDSAVPVAKKGKIRGKVNDNFLVSMEKVRENLGKSNHILIDSRSHDRFLGKNETIDPVAGRIEGAVNFFWKELVKPDGNFLSDEEIKEHFKTIEKEKTISIYCGSGVTACFNWLALKQIGIESSVYAGSWSDWISYPENLSLIKPKFS